MSVGPPIEAREAPVNILLVDDQAANLVALEAILSPFGENLVLARSGREALRCLLEQEFAVVLLDVQMPEIDGFATAELIRARDRTRHTPILFLTAIDRTERQALRGYALGAADYVFKPVAPEILCAKVAVFVELFRRGRREAKARDELARSNRDLEEFAHVIAHDLQAPLRSVTGHLESLARKLGPRLDDDAKPLLDEAVGAAARMRVQIRDLLKYARFGERPRTSVTAAADAFEHAVANLRGAIAETGAQITHQPLPIVRADPVELVQLFQNLIDNALKFRSQAAPRIDVRARRVDAFEEFTVEDNGIGLDEGADAERIFGVFQRLHTREEFPGNGIGLSICRRVVENYGGRIWVRSHPRAGATFHFTLPAVDGAPPTVAAASAGGDRARQDGPVAS